MVPLLLPPQVPGLSCTGMSGDSQGHPGMVPPLLPPQIPGLSCTGMSGDSLETRLIMDSKGCWHVLLGRTLQLHFFFFYENLMQQHNGVDR